MSMPGLENKGDTAMENIFYIERLTLGVLVFFVLPFIIRKKIRTNHQNYKGYFIAATKAGLLAAKWAVPFLSTQFEQLSFRLVDIIDEAGVSLRLRIEIQDLIEVQKYVLNDRNAKKTLLSYLADPFFNEYLGKEAVSIDLHEDTMGRVVFLIQVAVWKKRTYAKA